VTKRGSRILILAVSITLGGSIAHAQTAPSTAPDDASPAPTTTSTQELSPDEIARRDLQALAAALYDASTAQTSRDEAARRLIARPGADARKVLTDALEDFSNPGAQLAAVRALANVTDPDPALIDRFFAAMGSTRQVADAAARALANYKDNSAVLGRMIAIARNDRRSTDAIRNAVVRALGLIIEKRSAETLVALLQKDDETAPLHAAAADALVQMTGLVEFGQDVGQWTKWWDANKQKSDADFRFDLVNRKAADGDRLAARYNELTAALRQTLTDVYGKTQQSNREELLIAWLRSPEPEIRAVGAGTVSYTHLTLPTKA
jgi:HEAT repeat protein